MNGKTRVKTPNSPTIRDAASRDEFLLEIAFTFKKAMKEMSKYISVKAHKGMFQKNSPRSFSKK